MNKLTRLSIILFILISLFTFSSCGKEHIHEYDEGKIIKEATCTEDGIKEYKCSCGEIKQEVLKQLTHIYETTKVEATCSMEGSKTTKCKLCGYVEKEEVIEKLEHKKVIDKEVTANCLNTGLTKGYHCDICGEILLKQEETPKTPHKYLNGSCVVCEILEPSKGLRYNLAPDKQSYIVVGKGAFVGDTVSIPSEYEGLPVTGIGDKAFYNDKTLVSITIPYTISVIGEEAFGLCINLKEVIYENDAKISTISKKAFSECKNLEIITIPKKVKTIGEMVFNECESLTEVIIEEGSIIEYIASDAFIKCANLKNIVLPENNDNFIITNGFLIAENNKEEFICYMLGRKETKVVIPDGIVKVNKYTFFKDETITHIVIPHSVKIIDEYACSQMANLKKVELNEGLEIIGNGVFQRCKLLSEITLPSTLISIGDRAFESSDIKNNLLLPSNLVKIGKYAFDFCYNIKKIYTEKDSKLECLGESAFSSCYKLEEVTLPKTLINIENYAFENCDKLKTVYYHGTIEDWYNINFSNQTATPMAYAKKIFMLDENNEWYEPTKIVVPDNITVINQFLFYGFASLKEVIIPNSVTTIKTYAFFECSNIEKVIISKSVETIERKAFGPSQEMIIYCEIETRPDNWYTYWNYPGSEIVWGYKNQ